MDRAPRPDFSWLRLDPRELPLEELQRVDDAASRGTDETGGAAGDAVAQPGVGLEITPPPLRSVWGVILSPYTLENPPSPAPPLALYDFAQIYHDGNDWQLVEGGLTGVALEVQGHLGLPAGVPHVFWPSEDAVRTQAGGDPAGAAGEKWRFSATDPSHVPLPPPGESGSGGCDFTVDGNACFEQDVTIQGDTTINNLTINNYLTLTNFFNVSVVTGVCPVYEYFTLVGYADPVRLQVGSVVERRTLRVPLGTELSDPFCEADPDSCCEGGSGAGSGGGPGPDNSCCSPMPPPVFWATRVEFDEECACVPACVKFTYDPGRDAWYSPLGTFAGCPGGAASGCFRVRCRAGLWAWDVADGADNLRLAGRIVRVACEPWYLFALFDDSAGNVLCAADPSDKNLFSYVVTEVDCMPSGSGGGGCCAGQTPRTWAVTLAGLTGDCASFNGTWTLTQDSLDPCLWEASAVGTKDVHFSIVNGQAVFSWDAGGGGGRTVYLDSFGGDCCSPLSLPLDTNNCDGAVPAAVTLTPACGTISSACCPGDLLPADLTARFSGSLAGLGSVPLSYDAGSHSWGATLSGTPCGDLTVSFICQFDGKWGLALLGGTQAGVTARLADTCSPFLWSSTGTSTGACVGTFGVEVTG